MLPPGLPPTDSRRWHVLRASQHRAPLARATLLMDSRRPTRPAMRPPSPRCDLRARTRYGRVGDRSADRWSFLHALSLDHVVVVAMHRDSCRMAGGGSPDSRAAVAQTLCAVACLTVALPIRSQYLLT